MSPTIVVFTAMVFDSAINPALQSSLWRATVDTVSKLQAWSSSNESAQVWMGRLWTQVTKCEYREPDRLLTDPFICGLNNGDIPDKVFGEVKTLEYIEEATSEHVPSWAQWVKYKWYKEVYLTTSKRSKALLPSSKIPRCLHVGLHMVTSSNIVVQGTHPSNALHMERDMENVTMTITSRQYAGHHRDSRQTSNPRYWARWIRRMRLTWECWKTMPGVLTQ